MVFSLDDDLEHEAPRRSYSGLDRDDPRSNEKQIKGEDISREKDQNARPTYGAPPGAHAAMS
jgi:hypothetical protein